MDHQVRYALQTYNSVDPSQRAALVQYWSGKAAADPNDTFARRVASTLQIQHAHGQVPGNLDRNANDDVLKSLKLGVEGGQWDKELQRIEEFQALKGAIQLNRDGSYRITDEAKFKQLITDYPDLAHWAATHGDTAMLFASRFGVENGKLVSWGAPGLDNTLEFSVSGAKGAGLPEGVIQVRNNIQDLSAFSNYLQGRLGPGLAMENARATKQAGDLGNLLALSKSVGPAPGRTQFNVAENTFVTQNRQPSVTKVAEVKAPDPEPDGSKGVGGGRARGAGKVVDPHVEEMKGMAKLLGPGFKDTAGNTVTEEKLKALISRWPPNDGKSKIPDDLKGVLQDLKKDIAAKKGTDLNSDQIKVGPFKGKDGKTLIRVESPDGRDFVYDGKNVVLNKQFSQDVLDRYQKEKELEGVQIKERRNFSSDAEYRDYLQKTFQVLKTQYGKLPTGRDETLLGNVAAALKQNEDPNKPVKLKIPDLALMEIGWRIGDNLKADHRDPATLTFAGLGVLKDGNPTLIFKAEDPPGTKPSDKRYSARSRYTVTIMPDGTYRVGDVWKDNGDYLGGR